MQRFALAVFFATIVIGVAAPTADEIHLLWLMAQNPVAYEAAVPIGAPPDSGAVFDFGTSLLRIIGRFDDNAGTGFLWSTLLLVPVVLVCERILGRCLRAYVVGCAAAAAASVMVLVGLLAASDGKQQIGDHFDLLSMSAIVGLVGALAASIALSANKSLERSRDA